MYILDAPWQLKVAIDIKTGNVCARAGDKDAAEVDLLQGPTGSRYPTCPELFFKYPTRPDPKIENYWVPGNKISF